MPSARQLIRPNPGSNKNDRRHYRSRQFKKRDSHRHIAESFASSAGETTIFNPGPVNARAGE